jgi:hypothetical protein
VSDYNKVAKVDFGRDWIARVWFEEDGAQDVNCGHDMPGALQIVANARTVGMRAVIFSRESSPRAIPAHDPIKRR